MVLDEKNCKDKINSLTPHDWHPLLKLIPEIENAPTFSTWSGGKKNQENVFVIPHFVPDFIVSEFLKVVYDIPIIINFDWAEWDEGREIANENFDFDSVDLVTKCKLITAIVRNDRFCEGALASAFESGLILKILKSMEKEINA
jgi:hypothetical protein